MSRLVLGLAVSFFTGASVSAAESDRALIGRHVVSTPALVRFVDQAGRPLGEARGGTVFDVLRVQGDMLLVDRGWVQLGDIVPQEQAIEFFSEKIGRDPSATAYASRARVWNYLGEFEKAVIDCDEALKLDAACPTAFDRRAQAWTGKGEIDKALADFEKAIALCPEYASTYSHRARAWLEKGDLDKALADCDAALDRDPTLYLPHYYRGRAFSLRGSAADQVLVEYNRAIELNPHYVPVLNARGNEWYARREFAKAEADYSRAIVLDPSFDLVHVHYNRANARRRLGHVEAAKADYEAALNHDGGYSPAMQGLAACFAIERNYEAALSWQQKALDSSRPEQKVHMQAVLAKYRAARAR